MTTVKRKIVSLRGAKAELIEGRVYDLRPGQIKYEIRHSKQDPTVPSSLEIRVKGNFYGTLLTSVHIGGVYSELSAEEQKILSFD